MTIAARILARRRRQQSGRPSQRGDRMTIAARILARRPVGDSGSMLVAMSAILVTTGIMGVVMSLMLVGQEATRFDQQYTQSIQGADAGVQDALFQVNQLPSDSTATSLASNGPVLIDGVEYTWTATRANADSLVWTVDSTGAGQFGEREVDRTVRAEIAQNPLFNMAAFADSSINFNGNNAATSYPELGQGQVGTNGTLTLLGSSTTVDSVTLYDWDANPAATRCDGQACSATTTTVGSRLDIGAAVDSGGFIQETIDACKAAGPLTAFVGSTIAARTEPYCFTSFYADTQNFVVTGSGTARVFIEGGDVTLGNKTHSDVNNDVPGSPTSVNLQIYTTGQTVSVYNQGDISAAIYAPNAACGGVTSNASTDFWGSMICKTIDNVGGWTFHYDTRLSSVGDGTWRIRNYSEP
jgi:hypothetical protein